MVMPGRNVIIASPAGVSFTATAGSLLLFTATAGYCGIRSLVRENDLLREENVQLLCEKESLRREFRILFKKHRSLSLTTTRFVQKVKNYLLARLHRAWCSVPNGLSALFIPRNWYPAFDRGCPLAREARSEIELETGYHGHPGTTGRVPARLFGLTVTLLVLV